MTAIVVLANGIAPMSYELRASRPDYLGILNLRSLSNEDIKPEIKGPVALTPPIVFDWNAWQTKLLKDLAALRALPARPAERWRAKRPTPEACDAFTTPFEEGDDPSSKLNSLLDWLMR
jgi:hypothetical protein